MKNVTPKRVIQRSVIAIGRTPILRTVFPDKLYLSALYSYVLGRKLNWKAPRRYTEKMQYLKIYDHDNVYTVMADKYRVKDYVTKEIGEQYVIPLIDKWDRTEDIDFKKLPDRFVLKCNHDGGVIIVKDKSKLNYEDTRSKLDKRLKRKFYYNGREWSYKNIKPCIICEEYLEDNSGELSDYKVMCFDGKARLIQVHKGRFSTHTQDFYDLGWNKLNLYQGDIEPSKELLPRPSFLDEMINLSEKLAAGIPHVRVDWYDYNGKLLFGEFTFYDSAGFDDFIPDEWNEIIGDWIDLSKVKRD